MGDLTHEIESAHEAPLGQAAQFKIKRIGDHGRSGPAPTPAGADDRIGSLERLAALAFHANKVTQNIGARRLFTIMEKCLEQLSFEAPERSGEQVVLDAALVTKVLGETADDEDLIQYDM